MPFINLGGDIGGGGPDSFHEVLTIEVAPGTYAVTASGAGYTDIDTAIATWRVIAPDTGSVKAQAVGVFGFPDPDSGSGTFVTALAGPAIVTVEEPTLELQERWTPFADGLTTTVTITAQGREGAPNGTFLQLVSDAGGDTALILESVRDTFVNPWTEP